MRRNEPMETYFEKALKWISCFLFLVVIAMYVFGLGESEAESALFLFSGT